MTDIRLMAVDAIQRQMVVRYERGESCAMIGRHFGVSGDLVRKILQARGVPRRRYTKRQRGK